MSKVALKQIGEGGLVMQIPEVWEANVDTYTEPDGRDCVMVEISAEEGDPRSIVVSYGPMPEGSDSFIEASDTYEELIGEIGDNGVDRLTWLYENRHLIGGLKFSYEPAILRFFMGELEPLTDWPSKLVHKFRKDFGDSL